MNTGTGQVQSPLTPLKPGDTVGILGGGQLGRMLAMAAAKLGLKTIIFAPGPDCPAAQTANRWINADYLDAQAIAEFGKACDVITYEFENIPVSAVEALGSLKPLFPTKNALQISSDRHEEKQFFRSIGVETTEYRTISNVGDLENALYDFGNSGILKTRRFGYDGKGQIRISPSTKSSLAEMMDAMNDAPCILEAIVPFEKEVSIIAARDQSGTIGCYDPAENHHVDGILRQSTVPVDMDASLIDALNKIAEKTLTALDYVGVLGIEFFIEPGGSIRVNEFAPRVHNSGHWTTSVCAVGQFEQHIRAIVGWPLGSTTRHANCQMTNIIGDDLEKLPEFLGRDNFDLELYGKDEIKPGRKMGHFTRIL